MGKGIKKRNIFGVFILVSMILGVVFIENSISAPVTVQRQTSIINGMNQTQILKICATNPLTIPSICQLSTNQGNMTINSSQCSNGGIPTGGICPASVVGLPANTTVKQTTTTPPPTPTSETVSITPIAYVIDNNGNNSTISAQPSIFSLPASFVSQQGKNINIDHGKVTLQIKFNGKPITNYQVNGTLFVKINGNNLHAQGIPWAISGVTDANGVAYANMQVGSGIVNTYVLNIADQASLINQASSDLNMTIANTSIQNVKSGKSFHTNGEQSFVSMKMDYSQNMIIKKDSSGNNIRGYPDDDTFTFASNSIGNNVATYTSCGKYAPNTQCFAGYMYSVTNGPDLGTATVYLETAEASGFEKLLGTISAGVNQGGSVKNIPYDSELRIVIPSKNIDKHIHTATSHVDYTFTCNANGCNDNLP